MQALKITMDGTISTVDLTDGDRQTLAGLQNEIDCRAVDVVALDEAGEGLSLDMWVDDEGLYTAHINPVATLVAKVRARAMGARIMQSFHGTVVFAASDADGATVGLPDETVADLEGLAESTKARLAIA